MVRADPLVTEHPKLFWNVQCFKSALLMSSGDTDWEMHLVCWLLRKSSSQSVGPMTQPASATLCFCHALDNRQSPKEGCFWMSYLTVKTQYNEPTAFILNTGIKWQLHTQPKQWQIQPTKEPRNGLEPCHCMASTWMSIEGRGNSSIVWS